MGVKIKPEEPQEATPTDVPVKFQLFLRVLRVLLLVMASLRLCLLNIDTRLLHGQVATT